MADKRCHSWPIEFGPVWCSNPPLKGRLWCAECEKKRIAYMDHRFADIQKMLDNRKKA